MKKKLGLALLALAVSLVSVHAESKGKSSEAEKNKKPKIKSEFNWQWPDSREQAISSCGQYLSFMKPKGSLLVGEAQAHFKLHIDIADALLRHLQSIHKKHGFRMDAKRCRSELIKAERVLMYNRKKSEKLEKKSKVAVTNKEG